MLESFSIQFMYLVSVDPMDRSQINKTKTQSNIVIFGILHKKINIVILAFFERI